MDGWIDKIHGQIDQIDKMDTQIDRPKMSRACLSF